jgi:hypothetical protein
MGPRRGRIGFNQPQDRLTPHVPTNQSESAKTRVGWRKRGFRDCPHMPNRRTDEQLH